ncbi:hypothetical protein FQN57_006286 [Myotisia sp. PD_48]|nr:hypothetical protein FQN57_006286 [Myotisia sp. PD_48]
MDIQDQSQDPNRSILLIHGAWHTPKFYEAFVHTLEARGHQVHCPHLPTCNGDLPPTKSLEDDVALIREIATKLADDGQEIDVIMHSYGGIAGTDALCGLGVEERARRGDRGGVKRLIYLTAFVPLKGQSLFGIFNGAIAPTIIIDDNLKVITATDPISLYYNDLPIEEAQYWKGHIVVHPKSAQFTPVKNEAFREIPVTYIMCDNDKGIIPVVQQMMIDNVKALGVEVQIEHCSGSHSPFLSMPQTLSDIIEKIIR